MVKYALSSSSSSALASEEVEDGLCCTGRTLLSAHEALELLEIMKHRLTCWRLFGEDVGEGREDLS